MQNLSRMQATKKNALFSTVGYFFNYIMQFISRTIFINILGATFLGLNGLFANILSILALAELGIGSAITFSLYKPLADNDTNKIKALMGLYKKAYNIIACVVLLAGICLMPFLSNFTKGMTDVKDLNLIYILFLLDSVLTYFLVYKRSIASADQKNYIITVYVNACTYIMYIVQIVVIYTTKSFIFYLLVQILFTALSNILIAIKMNKMYPYIKNIKHAKLDKESKKDIMKKIRAMSYHQIGSVVVFGTDNLLISSFVGVFETGLYSNYVLITNILSRFLGQLFNSVTASIGNLIATESIEKSEDIFNKLFFITFITYGFFTSCLYTLLNPCISLWIGEKYLFSMPVVFIIVMNFYFTSMRSCVLKFKNATGLFYQDRYKALAESIINLIASITFLKYYGLVGVFLGTLISTITTCVWVEPYVLYKYHFKNGLKKYFSKYFIYTSTMLFSACMTSYISNIVFNKTWSSFIIISIITSISTILIFTLAFYRTKEFKYFKNLLVGLIKRNNKVKYKNEKEPI